MERISIFDMYKIGVGPSSSHTLGPWKAANRFAKKLSSATIDAIEIHLFGSLSKTGIGHGTDIACMLGLQSFDVETIDTSKISDFVFKIKDHQQIEINGVLVPFNYEKDIIFHNHSLPFHPNALTFKAYKDKALVLEETYFSVGGGFILQENEDRSACKEIELPYPIDYGHELLAYTKETGLSIEKIVYQNELRFRSETEIREGVMKLFNTMLECVFKGCNTGGILPGGLNVTRRAQALSKQLLNGHTFERVEDWLAAIKNTGQDFNTINKWISCFALAVNEENASLGRVVTSPTNGAAGVIPAVLLYYYCFCNYKGERDIIKFMLTSGEIGSIFKKGATISAAMGGCQAEIGVSSAMAAGGLTELLGGSPKQVLMAAEIAMEHHLGLTCDPIGGLVQIPCIERNAMGAIKAITASNLALTGNPDNAIVNLDVIVKTMWETALDMSHKYKETAEGGLAINVSVVLPNC